VTAVSPAVGHAVEQALRDSWGRLLALLTRLLGSLDLAEESLQDAFEAAVTAWQRDGVPDRPEAWLLTAARRRAVDRLRREATLARKLPLLVVPETAPGPEDIGELDEEGAELTTIPDERLRLLFTCCHPALSI
jgi:RNA polymerase sigma-70 factor, ECF subfamily